MDEDGIEDEPLFIVCTNYEEFVRLWNWLIGGA